MTTDGTRSPGARKEGGSATPDLPTQTRWASAQPTGTPTAADLFYLHLRKLLLLSESKELLTSPIRTAVQRGEP